MESLDDRVAIVKLKTIKHEDAKKMDISPHDYLKSVTSKLVSMGWRVETGYDHITGIEMELMLD